MKNKFSRQLKISKHAQHTKNAPPLKHQQSDEHRRNDLARLLPLWPVELADLSLEGRQRIVATLEKALRVERQRGKAGHWAYDLARHAALSRTWKNERTALQAFELRGKIAEVCKASKSKIEARSTFVVFLRPGRDQKI
jgi:hypothetical protein